MAPVNFSNDAAHLTRLVARRIYRTPKDKWTPRAVGGLIAGIIAIFLLIGILFYFAKRRWFPNKNLKFWARHPKPSKKELETEKKKQERPRMRDMSSGAVPDDQFNAAVQAGLKPAKIHD